jgi:methylmalonyl-CoA/ethylmalonyl-CoA epimerase
MKRIEHIGIAVNSLEEGKRLFTALLGEEPYKEELVESDGVLTVFYQVGESKIELLIPTRDDSPVQKFLSTHGPGIHHIAFGVDKIGEELSRLDLAGFQLIDKVARPGADNNEVAYLHPRSTGKVLVELCAELEN